MVLKSGHSEMSTRYITTEPQTHPQTKTYTPARELFCTDQQIECFMSVIAIDARTGTTIANLHTCKVFDLVGNRGQDLQHRILIRQMPNQYSTSENVHNVQE